MLIRQQSRTLERMEENKIIELYSLRESCPPKLMMLPGRRKEREGRGWRKKEDEEGLVTLLTVNVNQPTIKVLSPLEEQEGEDREKIDVPLLDACSQRKVTDRDVEMQVAEKIGETKREQNTLVSKNASQCH